MTPQEIFDKVARHLLAQNARSVSPTGLCKYRGLYGRMCAVGCLIPDAAYTPSIEGATVSLLIDRLPGLPDHFRDNEVLLNSLQGVHDTSDVGAWPSQLLRVSRVHNLSAAVLKGFAQNEPTI